MFTRNEKVENQKGKLVHSFNQSFTPNFLHSEKFFINFVYIFIWIFWKSFAEYAKWRKWMKNRMIHAHQWHLRQVVSSKRSIPIPVEFQSIPCLVDCMVPKWSTQWHHCCQHLHLTPIHVEYSFQCLHLVWHSQCISRDWQNEWN